MSWSPPIICRCPPRASTRPNSSGVKSVWSRARWVLNSSGHQKRPGVSQMPTKELYVDRATPEEFTAVFGSVAAREADFEATCGRLSTEHQWTGARPAIFQKVADLLHR